MYEYEKESFKETVARDFLPLDVSIHQTHLAPYS
jgi:hypothetical protein